MAGRDAEDRGPRGEGITGTAECGPGAIVVWGTYDLGKPRVRILLRGLRENRVPFHECHVDVWGGVEDKTQVRGVGPRLRLLVRWLSAYPRLLVCYLRLPAHKLVLVPYMGHLDVLILWPFARLRGARIVWDAFLSLYDTVVEDRRIVSKRHPLAWGLYGWEWLAVHAADRVFLDTRAHADYFRDRYGIPDHRLGVVFVGAETERFPRLAPATRKPGEPLTVLFYGQFIPLHGIETIVRAAQKLDDGSVRWVLIGTGQEEPKIRKMLADGPVHHLEWKPWVSYDELIDWIRRAHVCLGIFGDSAKAGRVIPNKVFQIVAAGRVLITRDSPAMRELFPERVRGLDLLPPADSVALGNAIKRRIREIPPLETGGSVSDVVDRITPGAVGRALLQVMDRALADRGLRVSRAGIRGRNQ